MAQPAFAHTQETNRLLPQLKLVHVHQTPPRPPEIWTRQQVRSAMDALLNFPQFTAASIALAVERGDLSYCEAGAALDILANRILEDMSVNLNIPDPAAIKAVILPDMGQRDLMAHVAREGSFESMVKEGRERLFRDPQEMRRRTIASDAGVGVQGHDEIKQRVAEVTARLADGCGVEDGDAAFGGIAVIASGAFLWPRFRETDILVFDVQAWDVKPGQVILSAPRGGGKFRPGEVFKHRGTLYINRSVNKNVKVEDEEIGGFMVKLTEIYSDSGFRTVQDRTEPLILQPQYITRRVRG